MFWPGLCLVGLFVLVSRLSNPRAGVAAVLVWATAPSFARAFSNAPSTAGIACAAVATAGLGVAALAPLSSYARTTALAAGVAGLGLGVWISGRWGSVALPATSVALTWLLAHRQPRGWIAALVGAASALAAAALALYPLDLSKPLLGLCGPDSVAAQPPTFDWIIAQLGHTFFPWSALLPWALASLTEPSAEADDRANALGLLLLIGSSLSLALGAVSARCTKPEPFEGAMFVAGAVGLWIGNPSRIARIPRVVWGSLGLLMALLALDFIRLPEKRWLAFAVDASRTTLGDNPSANANAVMLFAVSVGLALAGTFIGWLSIPIAPARPRWARLAQLAPALGTLLGALLLRFGYYPGLAEQLSTDGVLQTYRARARQSDALGLLGVSRQLATRDGVTPELVTSDTSEAANWLASATADSRRFIALDRALLPRLNAEFRSRHAGQNLPVLDARSERLLLGANHLATGERNDNPLERLLIAAPPADRRPLDAEFGDRLRLLGWQVLGPDQEPLGAVPAGSPFSIHVYYEVSGGDLEGHCTFLHIEHRPSRYTAEHTAWREYPLALWRPGDRIVDVYEIDLPLHFRAGSYPVHFGVGVLPCKDDRRLPVTRGSHTQERVNAGTLVLL